MAMGVGKDEIESRYYYDELITMLDVYAFANADEKEKKRWATHKARYKVLHGMPVTREEFRMGRLF